MPAKKYRVTYLVVFETYINPEHYDHLPEGSTPEVMLRSDIDSFMEGGCTLEELVSVIQEIAVADVTEIKE